MKEEKWKLDDAKWECQVDSFRLLKNTLVNGEKAKVVVQSTDSVAAALLEQQEMFLDS